MSYFIYYQPTEVPEGHTGDCVDKYTTKEEVFLAKFKLEQGGNRNVIILKEVKIKVEMVDQAQ